LLTHLLEGDSVGVSCFCRWLLLLFIGSDAAASFFSSFDLVLLSCKIPSTFFYVRNFPLPASSCEIYLPAALPAPHIYRRRYYYYYYIIYSYLLLVGYQTISLSNSLLSYSSHPPSSPLSLSLFFISYYLRTYYLHVLFLLRSTLLCSLFISWRKDGFMIYSCFSFRTEEEDARRCS
jgi:hypothetical protein